ncbi:MAG: glycoside hydrolase family 15 protein [Streptosporangiales bacterium]|nr:glycoside hydrolase family 15 protein [Streptosporangiales bacterium]
MVGDMQSAALIGRDGSVDWMCLPRFDSSAFFTALLGDRNNGRWSIRPENGEPRAVRRRYRADTLILETEWDAPEGTVRLIDFMPPRHKAPDIVRIVEGVSGTVPMTTEMVIRFDYGRVVPWMRRQNGDIAGVAGPDSVWLRSPVQLRGHNFSHGADFEVRAGERVPFVLTWHPSWEEPPEAVDPELALRETEEYWTEWASHCTYAGEWRDAVVRSLITLKALTYEPTGGIVAAPTASLPEDLGGERNWDYRYCWLRDATITLEALLRTGYTEEADEWREWLVRAVAGSPDDMQIMYTVLGERRIPEWTADFLSGYENSRPVRIGNGAAGQLQLDVYGEVMDALYLARQAGLSAAEHVWAIQRTLLTYLEKIWDEPDDGLWEIRGTRRHFVHSKVMAWSAFDRGIRMIEDFGRKGPLGRWRKVRNRIHAEVCEQGFDPKRNTFTQFYGSSGLDAALLMIPEVGFLPYDDPRVVGTIEAVRKELTVEGFVLRYDPNADGGVDGLRGEEGAFLACSFWMADALSRIGRGDDALEQFERLLSLRNDVGLLSEEYDPRYNRLVGNMPQAFSHVPLIRTALNLSGFDGARRGTGVTPPEDPHRRG